MNSPPQSDSISAPALDSCWRHIGVWGDQSCPQLAEHTHCGNCPVYSDAGRKLFEREAPEDYLREAAKVLRHPVVPREETVSALVFRLGPRWLALPATVVVAVSEVRPIHQVPRRSGKVFAGLVNIAGELQLAFSLPALLELPATASSFVPLSAQVYPRLLLCKVGAKAFAFAVDEVYGTVAFVMARMMPAAADGSVLATFSRGQFMFSRRPVRLLDDELLAHAVARQSQS